MLRGYNRYLLLLTILLSSCAKEFLNPYDPAAPVLDADGNEYTKLLIGEQVWMVENLRTTTYSNGDPILNTTIEWGDTIGAWVYYDNDDLYNNPYGKLYNWYAMKDARNVCPIGWHVPSNEEWAVLSDYLGGHQVAGGKMKSTGTEYWSAPNVGATNESGFSGHPGGSGGININGGYFGGLGDRGNWWSATHDTTPLIENGIGWMRFLDSDRTDLESGYLNLSLQQGQYFSIRCVKD